MPAKKSTKSRVSSKAKKGTDKKLFIALGVLVIAIVAVVGIVYYRQSQASNIPRNINGVTILYPYRNYYSHTGDTQWVCYYQGHAIGPYTSPSRDKLRAAGLTCRHYKQPFKGFGSF